MTNYMVDIKSLLNFWKGKRYIGLDIGANCAKIAVIDKGEQSVRLVKTGIVKMPNSLDEAEKTKLLQSYINEKNIPTTGNIAVNIEDNTLLIRRMSVAKMPERDMKIAIKWNFREFIEGSIDDYIVSYSPVQGYKEGDKTFITSYCISRASVEARSLLIKNSGMRVSSIEPNASALLAAFCNAVVWKLNESYVVLDLGDSVSNFTVIGNGCLLFSRLLMNLNGIKLKESIKQELLLKDEDPENILKEYMQNLSDNKLSENITLERKEKIDSIISQFISKLIVELQRSIDAYCIMYKKEHVDKIYICGGGVVLPSVGEKLSNSLGVSVEIFNPFVNIKGAESAFKMISAPLYSVAIGLALPREK